MTASHKRLPPKWRKVQCTVAIVSENYAESALLYQAVFGMRTSDKTRAALAQAVGDGYVGLSINPRRAGRKAGSTISASRSTTRKPRSTDRKAMGAGRQLAAYLIALLAVVICECWMR